ncbi:MAG: hypothetical protein ACXVR1_17815 [Solirubrobacteraceae bacterium]
MRVLVQTAVAVVLLCGCAGTSRRTTTSSTGGCPVSTPAGPRPPHRALLNFGDPIARASDPGWYGNGVLWTQLPTFSEQRGRLQGAMLHLKIPWFRAQTGAVTIDAAPVGGPPSRFSAQVGTPAEYGRFGFAPSILQFGRAGCWRLHAHLASRVLTLVVRVAPAA